MATNEDCLNNFLKAINDNTDPNYRDPHLIATRLFSPDSPAAPANPTTPMVGITDHGSPGIPTIVGPGFVGRLAIEKLFNQLFIAFNPLSFVDLRLSRLYSSDAQKGTIAIRLNLIGTHQGPWFSSASGAFSLPLSAMAPVAGGPKNVTIPTCAVFTFDDKHLINQLGFYMDRYRLMRDLQATAENTFDTAIENFLRTLHPSLTRKEKRGLFDEMVRLIELEAEAKE